MRFSYERYHEFSAPLEGRVPCMYCDTFGYVTTGVGNLINALPEALALPWQLADGSPADKATVAAEWHMLHDNGQHYGRLKWTVYAKQLKCRLSDQAIDDLVKRTLSRNEAEFRKRWPSYDTFPADAQLAIISMSWAVGSAFYRKFHNLAGCIDREDWDGAAASCKIRDGLDTPAKSDDNPGIVPRNARNKFLFHNAALVAKSGADGGVLYWPDLPPTQSADHAAALAAKREADEAMARLYASVDADLNRGAATHIREDES